MADILIDFFGELSGVAVMAIFILHYFIVGWCLFALAFVIYDNSYAQIIKKSQEREAKAKRLRLIKGERK